jgi:hypothetical protein
MPKAWHIIAETRQTGAQSNVAPFREYFVVAIANLDQAVESLRMRKNLFDAKLSVVGEATVAFIDELDITDGQIISVGAYS